MTLIDRAFLRAQLLYYKILKKNLLLVICDIEINYYFITKYINLNIYVLDHYNSNR